MTNTPLPYHELPEDVRKYLDYFCYSSLYDTNMIGDVFAFARFMIEREKKAVEEAKNETCTKAYEAGLEEAHTSQWKLRQEVKEYLGITRQLIDEEAVSQMKENVEKRIKDAKKEQKEKDADICDELGDGCDERRKIAIPE